MHVEIQIIITEQTGSGPKSSTNRHTGTKENHQRTQCANLERIELLNSATTRYKAEAARVIEAIWNTKSKILSDMI